MHREQALAKRHSLEHEKWTQHTRALSPLSVGDHVYLQNLTGNHPKRWERTGTVVEVRQFHQYVIKVDGSGRLTLRNRQHLRKFTPFKTLRHEDIIETIMRPTGSTEEGHEDQTPTSDSPAPILAPPSTTPSEDQNVPSPTSPPPVGTTDEPVLQHRDVPPQEELFLDASKEVA